MNAKRRFSCLGMILATTTLVGCAPSTTQKDIAGHMQTCMSDLLTDLDSLSTAMYDQAESHNSIGAYKVFLDAQGQLLASYGNELQQLTPLLKDLPVEDELKNLPTNLSPKAAEVKAAAEKRKNLAYENIYVLVAEADFLPGYRYFLETFEEAPEPLIKKASDAVVTKVFLSAKEVDTSEIYMDFLRTYPGAPAEMRNEALKKAVSLKKQAMGEDLDRYRTKEVPEDESKLVERIDERGRLEEMASQLRAACLKAHTSKDAATYQANYLTLTECELFEKTTARVDMIADDAKFKYLSEIQQELATLRSDVAGLRVDVVKGFEKASQQLDELGRQMESVIKAQRTEVSVRVMDYLDTGKLPFAWNRERNAWGNFVEIGREALPVFVSLAAD